MALLVIDTATAACSVALIEAGTVVAARHEQVGRGHAERLMPMIADLLDGCRPDRLLVDCGPGSFTGIRVGLAAARGLALAWGVPLAGFSSTALLAAAAEGEDRCGVALIGGHGELFVQSFALSPLAPSDALRSLPPEEAGLAITAPLVIGSGAEALVAARGWGTARVAFPDAADAVRLPAELASLAPVPLYGRAPDAKPPA